MVPNHASDWMQLHLKTLGRHRLRDVLWMPGSHDAGMYFRSWWTIHGTEARTLTQSMRVYDQLMHGARWLDIRPMVRNGEWSCGHFSFIWARGWQGATGQTLHEVVQDIKRFLDDHHELVILKITHVHGAEDGRTTTHDEQEKLVKDLFDDLKKHALQSGQSDCLDEKLENYITENGKPIGRVIITAVPEDGPGVGQEIFERAKKPFMKYDAVNVSVTQTQDDAQAILAFVPGNSVKDLAKAIQLSQFPLIPQQLMQEKECGILPMDYIQDDRLLTACLAASLAQDQVRTRPSDDHDLPIIVVYGGLQITDRAVLNGVLNAAKDHGQFLVNNGSMKQDPWPGVKKSCVAYYLIQRAGGWFPQGRFGWEDEYLSFQIDPEMIWFHDRHLTGPVYKAAYFSLFAAILQGKPFRVGLETLGVPQNEDPAPGTKKHLVIRYRSQSGRAMKERRLVEHETTDLGLDIDWITYHDQLVPHAEAYEQFFWRLDHDGGELVVSNTVMGHPNPEGFDPAPGVRKLAEMRWRLGAGYPFETVNCMEHDTWSFSRLTSEATIRNSTTEASSWEQHRWA